MIKVIKYPPRQQLSEIVVIRPILVVLLVFYHAFAIYGGAWEPIDGYPEIRVYWWFDWLSFAFMLEMFVFISGYVFGYQVRTKGEEKLNAKKLFPAKFKRLIMPCALFSLLYILLFGDISQPLRQTLYGLVNGVAHMWFLPMLFWCFVGVWIIEKMNLNPYVALILCFVISLISVNGLPLQLSHTMYYMFFFYFGYALQRNNIELKKYYSTNNIIITIVSFIVIFVYGTLLREHLVDFLSNPSLPIQMLKFMIGKFCMLAYSIAGIVMLIVLVGTIQKNNREGCPRWIIEIGNLCFGVYLFQQFVLHALYYNTDLPQFLGVYWLPWVGFIIALICSLIISWMIRQTKVGRAII